MSSNIGALVILQKEDGQLLLGCRKGGYRAGSWGFPGGRCEVGEPLEECAQRELAEETGLHAEELEYVGLVKEFQPDNNFDFIHFAFLCRKWSGELVNLEPDKCENWEWLAVEDVSGDLLPGHLAGWQLVQTGTHFIELGAEPQAAPVTK